AFICIFSASSAVSAQSRAPTLASKIEEVTNRPEYQHARWGILIVDTNTGETLYAHEPERLFIPASTTKLYSCAAAWMASGADRRFKTPVHRRGEVRDGRLVVDLILEATGDPTLGGRTNAQGEVEYKDNDHIYANGGVKGEVPNTEPLAGLNELAKQV